MGSNVYPQGHLTCPVCNKEFEANNDTRYIIRGGYTCNWNCFIKEVRLQETKKKEEVKNNKDNKS